LVLDEEGGVSKEDSALFSRVIKTMIGRFGKPKLQPFRTRIVQARTSTSSAAGAALSWNPSVEPALSGEWTYFSALFDEAKVHGGELRYAVTQSAGSVSTTAPPWNAVAYDPLNSGSASGIAQLLTSSQHRSEVFGLGPGYAVAAGALNVVSPNGYRSLHFRCPKGASMSTSSITNATGNIPGQWGSTSDTADTWGYLHGYHESLGNTAVVTIVFYVILDVTFRSRA